MTFPDLGIFTPCRGGSRVLRTHTLRRALAAVSCCLSLVAHGALPQVVPSMPGAAVVDALFAQLRPALPEIVNFTGLEDAEVQQLLASTASDAVLSELSKRQHAPVFWVEIVRGDRASFCYAAAWLAPVDRARRPRIPQLRFDYLMTLPENGDDEMTQDECRRAALAPVMRELVATPWAVVKMHADDTQQWRAPPGTVEPPRPGKVVTVTFSGNGRRGSADAVLAEILLEKKFGERFDYRNTQVIAFQAQFRTETAAICVAVAGVSAAPPAGYAPRLPAVSRTAVVSRELAGLDRSGQLRQLDACVNNAMQDAATKLLAQPWDSKGLLVDFAATTEPEAPAATRGARIP